MTVTKDRAAFTIDRRVLQVLKERVPEQQRSKFVEQAVTQALAEANSGDALKLLEETKPWPTNGKNSVETLRDVRRQWGGRLASSTGKAS